jgi:DNA-binding NtrC family response regulator
MFLVLTFRSDRPLEPAYRFAINDACYILGRGAEVGSVQLESGERQIALPDLGISRRHAELRPDPEGETALWVSDLGSTNGMYLAGEPTVHGCLRPGKLLEAGACFFVLVEGDLAGIDEPECVAFSSTTDPSLDRAIARFAADSNPVLLVGEVGSGAHLIAEDLHQRGRATGPFVIHETGLLADSQQRAQGGTIFVPDIEALGSRQLAEVAAELELSLGARLVLGAATSAALAQLGPLAARLEARCIQVPPLRDRRHDVGRLASRALEAALRRSGPDRGPLKLTRTASRLLLSHDWAGGFAELAAACEMAVGALQGGDTLEVEHLPAWVRNPAPPADPVASPASETAPLMSDVPADALLRGSPAERASTLRALLAVFGGNVSALARWLGRSRRQMHRWINAEEIDVDLYRRV